MLLEEKWSNDWIRVALYLSGWSCIWNILWCKMLLLSLWVPYYQDLKGPSVTHTAHAHSYLFNFGLQSSVAVPWFCLCRWIYMVLVGVWLLEMIWWVSWLCSEISMVVPGWYTHHFFFSKMWWSSLGFSPPLSVVLVKLVKGFWASLFPHCVSIYISSWKLKFNCITWYFSLLIIWWL